MKRINSLSNPLIKQLVSLHTSKGRQLHQLFLAEGWRTCLTLIQAQQNLIHCIITENLYEQASQHIHQENLIIVPEQLLKKISQTSTPSGIIGVFAIPPQPSLENLRAGIVLANITDPGNMGTLIRTCTALGKKTVVLIEGVDPWNSKVVQSSAGTIGHVTIFQLSWHELGAHKKDLLLYALVVHGGNKPSTIVGDRALLVIGNEAHGLPQEWQNDCQEKITIAMPGDTESLNAAIAGSLAMYLAWMPRES